MKQREDRYGSAYPRKRIAKGAWTNFGRQVKAPLPLRERGWGEGAESQIPARNPGGGR
jgi:hypothetical protein